MYTGPDADPNGRRTLAAASRVPDLYPRDVFAEPTWGHVVEQKSEVLVAFAAIASKSRPGSTKLVALLFPLWQGRQASITQRRPVKGEYNY